jgi:DHA1 family purine base/nucleoside efflux pump-like MFS transporter
VQFSTIPCKTNPRAVTLQNVLPAGLLNMFTLGASATLYGPSLVYIAQETGQPLANLGILFVSHWAGFFVSAFAANRIAKKFEMRRGLMMGVMLIAFGVLGLITLPFPFNLTMAFLVGLGNGTSEVLFNRLTELLAGVKPAEALTKLHSTWGVGAIAIPLVVAGVVLLGWNWRVAGIFVIASALLDISLIARWSEFSVPHGDDMHWRTLPWKSISLFIALFAIYVGVETAVGAWATTFFAELGQGAILGSIATSVFFLTFSFGRMLFASATDRLGFGRAVRVGTLAGAAALLLTFIPQLAIVGFALTGIAFSIVFPTLLAWAPRRHPERRAQMMSISLAASGSGGIVFPFIIGISVGAIGAWTLTPLLIGTALLVAALSLREPNRV